MNSAYKSKKHALAKNCVIKNEFSRLIIIVIIYNITNKKFPRKYLHKMTMPVNTLPSSPPPSPKLNFKIQVF